MSKMREAFEKWFYKPSLFPTGDILEVATISFEAGYQAALADVKAGGAVAFGDCLNQIRTESELDWMKVRGDKRYLTYDRPLYKLPEDV